MSFPKNNIALIFADLPPDPVLQKARTLYLPLKRSRKYFKHFNCSKGRHNLYIYFSFFSNPVKQLMKPFIDNFSKQAFSFLHASTIETEFPSLEVLCSIVQQLKQKRRFNQWMKIIQKVEKWNRKHQIQGKLIIICSLFLYYAYSKNDVKRFLNM